MIRLALLVALCLALAPTAHAQQSSWLWWGTDSNHTVPVSAANPLPVTGAGSGLTVGTTTITGGTTQQLLFDNAGKVGEITTGNSGVLVTSGAGVPSISTTLPSGLAATNMALTTPALGVATATSVAAGGCTIGTNALCATGTTNLSSTLTVGGALINTFDAASVIPASQTAGWTTVYDYLGAWAGASGKGDVAFFNSVNRSDDTAGGFSWWQKTGAGTAVQLAGLYTDTSTYSIFRLMSPAGGNSIGVYTNSSGGWGFENFNNTVQFLLPGSNGAAGNCLQNAGSGQTSWGSTCMTTSGANSTSAALANILGTAGSTAESYAGPWTFSNATIKMTGITTGTNADTVCLNADGTLQIQAAACTISSLRFKNLIGDYVNQPLDVISRLDPIVFTMKGENIDWNYDKPQIGLSAENVAAIEPRCAVYEQDGVTPKSYRQECLIAVLVAAVKDQQREIAELRRAEKHD